MRPKTGRSSAARSAMSPTTIINSVSVNPSSPGTERWLLQAVAASDNRQRQAEAPGPMCRKCRVSHRAPELERPHRKPYRLSGEGQFASLARLHADDRDLLGV